MISFLREGLSTPAEIVAGLLSLLGFASAQLSRRLAWATAALLLGWTTLSATFRQWRGPLGTEDLPLDEWAPWLASQHAAALRVAWLGALGASLVVALTSERPEQPGPGDRVSSQVLLISALVLGASAFGAPLTAPAALVALGLSWGANQRQGVALAVASGLLSLAALWGSGASLYRTAALLQEGDLAMLDARALGRAVAWVGALACAIGGLRMLIRERSVRGGLVYTVLALLAGWMALWGQRSLSWGPVPLEASSLPVQSVALPARVVRGCVISEGGEVTAWGGASCPERPPLPREAPTFFAGTTQTPTERLLGLVQGGGGDVGVLARMDGGWALPSWRVTAVPVVVRSGPPVEPALRLLPEPVLAERRKEGWVDAQGVPLPQAIASRSARTPRLDVLVPVSAAPVLGELVEVCAVVQRAARGARCVLAAGEISAYTAPPVPGAPIEVEFEVIEEE